MLAWACWGISTLAVLLSFHFSQLTIKDGIKRIDDGKAYEANWGGKWAIWLRRFNIAGPTFFFAGVVAILVFTSGNFYLRGASNAQPQAAAAVPASAAA